MVDPISLLAVGGGQIAPALYIGTSDEVVSLIAGYLATGYERAAVEGIDEADADGVATAWAYYVFYQALAESMAARPSSVDIKPDGAQSWSSAQMLLIERRAAFWHAQYEAEIAAFPPAGEATAGWVMLKSLRSR